MPADQKGEVLIVGGGIAGLSSAWWLLKRGYPVRILEAETCGSGSSRVAAGMLAPVHELEFTELPILQAGLDSINIYKEWEQQWGDIGLHKTGTLEVASGPEDVPYLKRQFEFQQQQGLDVYWLDNRDLLLKEPLLSPQVPCGIFAPGDWQIENRFLLPLLQEKITEAGGIIQEHTRFKEWNREHNRVKAVTGAGEIYEFEPWRLVMATGSQVPEMDGHPRIVPVKGEMAAFEKSEAFPLRHTIRIRNRRLGNGYVVPKKQTILAGSTSEHRAWEEHNTMGGILDIFRKCYQVLPGMYDLVIQEIYSGFRPASDDHLPQIGRVGSEPVFYLNGLYRHGILLGPWAGKQLAQLVHDSK